VSDDGATRSGIWRAHVPRLSRFALEHLLLLPIGAGAALLWVNLGAESYYRFAFKSAFWVNDVAMVFFFGLVTKEVVEATAPAGELHPWRRALLPAIASIGATLVPALIYTQMVDVLDEPMLSLGWPVTFATDIAIAYFTARIIFPRHPAVPFVLLLAIASDVWGFVAIAWAQPSTNLGIGALIMAGALAIAFVLRMARLRSFWPYLIIAGSVSWYALYRAGLHPVLALVPIMPFLPHAARDPGFFVDADPHARDALSQFEVWWRYPGQIALFFFGLVNAGVPFHALESGALGLPIAVMTGKPVGVLLASGVAIAAGLHLPPRTGWRELLLIGLISSIGFSIALYFCAALLGVGQLRSETEMGAFLCLFSMPIAILFARLMRVGRFARHV
jgi:NhaA family Na+:H+ antiporter